MIELKSGQHVIGQCDLNSSLVLRRAPKMEIPEFLLTQIREQSCVLFLGAGASKEAKKPDGTRAPTGAELAHLLADRFLGGRYRDYPLNQVAEYAMNESDLGTVQSYIRDIFTDLRPTEAHRRLSDFIWYGLATTNYDLLIENAYAEATSPLQSPQEMVEDTDRVEDRLRDPHGVLLLKLHGSITRINNPDCPLILTTEQYIQHRQGRARLFDVLRTWAYEHPFVFIGHSLQDSDIRAVLLGNL